MAHQRPPGGVCVPYELSAYERELCLRAASVIGLEYTGIDLLPGPDGPVLLEVNGAPQWHGPGGGDRHRRGGGHRRACPGAGQATPSEGILLSTVFPGKAGAGAWPDATHHLTSVQPCAPHFLPIAPALASDSTRSGHGPGVPAGAAARRCEWNHSAC